MIRVAEAKDLPEIVAIYNEAVVQRGATADLSPLTVDDRRPWFEEHKPDSYPIWIFQDTNGITGWCCLSPHRPGRMAMRFTAEISYYVGYRHHGKGIGSALLEHTIREGRVLGKKTLFAMLLDVNTISINLLEKFGFKEWGRMPAVADIDGAEFDHLIYGLRIL
jgi:L-amino acid N-acyltransferase YncA